MSAPSRDLAAARAARVHEAGAAPFHPWPTTREGWDELADCGRCGLTMLRLFQGSATWVRRRVEHVTFLDDRTVRRRMSVDYVTPSTHEAVSFRRGDEQVRVIPLTIMRRKSLVRFDLRDEQNAPLPLLGLREAQALTKAIVRAWAAAALADDDAPSLPALSPSVGDFVDATVDGDQAQLRAAYHRFAAASEPGDDLARLARDPIFRNMVERFAGSFLLFTLDAMPDGSRRIVKFAYDEPLTLRYSTTSYKGHPDGPLGGVPGAEPGEPLTYGRAGRWLDPGLQVPKHAALGWTPTLIRFPVPAAELAASFHVEVQAPPNISIVKASLLAGRPNLLRTERNDPDEDLAAWADAGPGRWQRRPSFDLVQGGYPTVDLHIADVPFGSLSRAQVALQPNTRGWLATAAASALLTTAILFALSFSMPVNSDIGSTVLLSFAAAVVALVARSDTHGMTARLLSRVRAWSLAPAVLMLLGALVLLGADPAPGTFFMFVLAAGSLVPTAVVGRSWWRARRALQGISVPERFRSARWGERLQQRLDKGNPDAVRLSPWEQYLPGDRPDEGDEEEEHHVGLANSLTDAPYPYDTAVRDLDFDKPAIKIASAEGGRSQFVWTEEYEGRFADRMASALARSEHRRRDRADERATRFETTR